MMFCPRKKIQTNVEIVKYDPVTNITEAVLTGPANNIIIAIGHNACQLPVPEMKQSLDNTCNLNTVEMISG